MIRKLLWIVFALTTATQAASFDPATSIHLELKPGEQQAQAAHLASELLSRYHYKSTRLDTTMSAKIFDHYLKLLDPEKLYLSQGDVDQLARFRPMLDQAIIKEDLSIPFAIFNLYAQRASERYAYARTLLKDGFDFLQKESYRYSREKEPWLKSEAEMQDLWRKRVKNDWLRLKIAGSDDQHITAILDKRYENAQKRIGRAKSEDAFQSFMNAYTMAIEPHTNYMGPRAAEDFDISMKLSLVGIGAALTEKDDYTTIRELIPGGPAMLSGQLNVGDRILGVAQGERGVSTDIVGWRLDDSVALIRGEADSIVRLDILPVDAGPDGKHKQVSIIRKKITLEDQAARKSVLSVTDGNTTRRVGVISLPGFYEDFAARQRGDREFKSATRDVARLLDQLKVERVDGVLIDLRNNGGGSLTEAVQLTGLFVGKGPVVQQRNANGQVEVERDPDAGVAWEGPLGVLINRGSASASEIFAAAIQDYGRGLVIGEPSFGKGTVQTMINLDEVAKTDKPKFGELKLTVAQFFRINGGTTQLRGVKPDISLPTLSDPDSYGESSFDNALPWVKIKAADFAPVGDVKLLLPALQRRHDARVRNDKEFGYLQEDIAEYKLQQSKNELSLNEAERRKEKDFQEAKLASRETTRDGGKSSIEQKNANGTAVDSFRTLRDDGLQPDERSLSKELADEQRGKNTRDIMLNEAAHIISDEADLLKPRARVASRARADPSPILDQVPGTGAVPAGVW